VLPKRAVCAGARQDLPQWQAHPARIAGWWAKFAGYFTKVQYVRLLICWHNLPPYLWHSACLELFYTASVSGSEITGNLSIFSD
jgi:hypothetical protein